MGDASNLEGTFDKAGAKVSGFAAKMGKVGKSATIAGVAVTAAFTKTFLDFTAYETKLVDMAKVTSEPFDQIEAKLGTLGPILGSSKDLMEGYYQVISAGVKDPVKALKTLTVAAETAKAAHVEQSEVVKGITKMMAGYEGAIESAAEAADLLFAIEKEGQTTVAELIPVIGGLAKMSSDLNVEQIAMAASMAVISKTAGSTAEAATQYQAVLTGMFKPTEDMTAAFEDMGFASADLAIEELGLVETLKSLEEYMAKTDTTAAELFGRKEAMIGFSALGAEGFRVLDDTIKSVEEGMGGASKAFDLWSETGAAAIDTIKNKFFNFSVSIGERVAPMFKNLLDTVGDIIDRVTEWAEENEKLVDGIIKWGAGLGVALAVLGPILMLLPALVTGIHLLSGAFLPFLVTGAIVAGIIKINSLLDSMNEKVYTAQISLNSLSVMEIDLEIESLAQEIKRLGEQIKITSELPLSSSAQFGSAVDMKNAIMNLEIKMGLLIERREELTKAELAGVDVTEERIKLDKEIAKAMEEGQKALEKKVKTTEILNALQEIENEIYKLTHTSLEIAIRDLDLQKQSYINLGVEIGVVDKLYNLQMKALNELNKTVFKCGRQFMKFGEDVEVAGEKLPTEYVFSCGQAFLRLGEDVVVMGDTLPELEDKFEDLENIAKPVIIRITGYLENQLAGAISSLLSQTKDFEWSWSRFWEGLKNTLIRAVSAMIAKLIVLAALSWLFPWLSFDKGGGVGFQSGGEVKGYAPGGGVDTIPAMLTPGEYVIAKPMTDFIRRFKAIPGNLIAAVAGGMPTPTPAFAGGGLVGGSGGNVTSFGSTSIYVDIHDNKISDDVDIKNLATKVSDEILRKLDERKRH